MGVANPQGDDLFGAIVFNIMDHGRRGAARDNLQIVGPDAKGQSVRACQGP